MLLSFSAAVTFAVTEPYSPPRPLVSCPGQAVTSCQSFYLGVVKVSDGRLTVIGKTLEDPVAPTVTEAFG